MWSPTHVQVTVLKARGLMTKGKNGTNDSFVTIALGKEKFQTSVKEKSREDVEWFEECELQIPKQGNVAEIVLTVLHRNFIGLDAFLGAVNIPLADFDVYEKPKSRWYDLNSKSGKSKTRARGELEVKISFLVKTGSLKDLQKKHRSSLGQLSHMAKSVVRRSKVTEKEQSETSKPRTSVPMSSQIFEDVEHRVSSGRESLDDFTLDDSSVYDKHPAAKSMDNLSVGDFSRRTSVSTLKMPTHEETDDEWDEKIFSKQDKDTSRSVVSGQSDDDEEIDTGEVEQSLSSQQDQESQEKTKDSSRFVRKLNPFRRDSKIIELVARGNRTSISEKRIVVGGENSKLSPEILQKYDGKSKEELIEIICNLEISMGDQIKKMKDLEDYLDNLLLRVMETSPRILQTPVDANKARKRHESSA